MNIDDDLNILILDNDHSARSTLQYQLGNNCKQPEEYSQNILELSDPYDLTLRQQIFRTQYFQFINSIRRDLSHSKRSSSKNKAKNVKSCLKRTFSQDSQNKKVRFYLKTKDLTYSH